MAAKSTEQEKVSQYEPAWTSHSGSFKTIGEAIAPKELEALRQARVVWSLANKALADAETNMHEARLGLIAAETALSKAVHSNPRVRTDSSRVDATSSGSVQPVLTDLPAYVAT